MIWHGRAALGAARLGGGVPGSAGLGMVRRGLQCSRLRIRKSAPSSVVAWQCAVGPAKARPGMAGLATARRGLAWGL